MLHENLMEVQRDYENWKIYVLKNKSQRIFSVSVREFHHNWKQAFAPLYLGKAVPSILLRLCFGFALITQTVLTSRDISSRDFLLQGLEITMMDCDLLYTKWDLTSAAMFSQRLNGIQHGILSEMFPFVTRKQQKK